VVRLQQSQDVKQACNVQQRIAKRLDAWEKDQITMLVEDTLQSIKSHLTSKQGSTMPEQRIKTFHQKALCGNIWGAIRCCTEQEKGGIIYPDNIDEKTGTTVQSALESKHPDARTLGANVLTNYPFLSNFVDLNITEDSIKVTAVTCPEAQGWEEWIPMCCNSGCCTLGKPVGTFGKPPPIWWIGLPIPSHHGLTTGPSWWNNW
jgi:hypothetical protein